MPTTLEDPPHIDEPSPDPIPEDSAASIKSMANKFRELMPGAVTSGPTKAASAAPTTTPPEPSAKEQASAPAKAEPAPGTSPATEPDDVPDLPPNAPATRQHFARLAQAKSEYKKLAEARKAQLEERERAQKALEEELAKVKAALPPNLDEVQKAIAESTRIAEENKRLTAEIETVSLERSPKFRRWWETESSRHVKIAQSHVPAEHRDAVAKLLLQPSSAERDAALDKIIGELPGVSQRLINGALEQLESLKIQRAEALEAGSERYKELQAHEAAERQREADAKQRKLQEVLTGALQRARSFDAFKPTGDATHDADIPKHESFVRAALSGQLDPDTLVQLPAMAVELLRVREKVLPALQAELTKANELIKQLQGASPSPSSGTGGKLNPNPRAEESAKAGTSFADKVRSLMER